MTKGEPVYGKQHWTQPFSTAERAWIAEEWAVNGHSIRAIAKAINVSVGRVTNAAYQFTNEMGTNQAYPYHVDARRAAELAVKLFRKYGTAARPSNADDIVELRSYSRARAEHAWLLRCEGEAFSKIGHRLGVSGTQARVLVLKFGRRIASAMRRATFTVSA